LSTAYAIKLLPLGGDRLEAAFSAPVIASFLAVAYAVFIFIALRPRTGGSSKNPFYILGLITYPLYLLHQELGYILLRSAPGSLNRIMLLCAVMIAMIVLSWLVHVGPEKWFASQLKAALIRPQRMAVALKSRLLQRLAGANLKTAMPAVVPATVSTGTSTAAAIQSSAANSPLTKAGDTL
jgi:peptidoglycan/LPS O-acetylase OafA/YrhL